MIVTDLFESAPGANPYGYQVGQTVKLRNGSQGQVVDIFDDSIEVLLPGGQTMTVDFRDAEVLDEYGMIEALGDNRPKLGSKRDQGKSVRKWRQARGLDESGMAEASNELAAMTTMGMGNPLDFSSDYALYTVQKGRELFGTMRNLYAKANALPPAERSKFYQRLDSLAYEGLGDEILRYSKTLTVDDLVAITDVLENYDIMFNTIAIPDELQDAEAAWKQYAAEVALARTQAQPGQTMHERSMSVTEELAMKHQRDHSTQKYADRSNSLAQRSFSMAQVPNVTKSADGHPTVKYRTDRTGKAGATRVDPTITPTTVNRKDSDKPIPAFLKKQGSMSEGLNNSKTIITEALIAQKLWKNAGRKLMEAQLTVDQINQIFQQIQQGATAAGGNRTMIGQGKDAATAVSKAWTDLKDKIYNSKPMTGFAAQYDKAAEKLKQATGGDAGAMKYVQKYRDFATKNPMLQSAIYAALIAASGISGVGIAGAAALGLFKLVDQALQGKDIRSAAWSGVKTGATAFAAGQIGQALKGQPAAGDVAPSGTADAATAAAATGGRAARDAVLKGAMEAADEALQAGTVTDYNSMTDTIAEIMSRYEGTAPVSPQSLQTIEQMVRLKLQAGMVGGNGILQGGKAVAGAAANAMKESVTLSESQIFLVIGKIVERQRKLDEGIMDTIKGAAGKAVNYAKTKGTNLTTKITADKLLQAWKKADSPMDSATVAKVMQDAGVPATSVQQVYSTMKIPFDAAPAEPAANPATPAAALGPGGRVNPYIDTPAPAAAPAAAPVGGAERQAYAGMTADGKPWTGDALRNKFFPTAPAAAAADDATAADDTAADDTATAADDATADDTAAAAPNPFGQMTKQMQNYGTSTGGRVTGTATGLKHTANPNNPNAVSATTGTPAATAATTPAAEPQGSTYDPAKAAADKLAKGQADQQQAQQQMAATKQANAATNQQDAAIKAAADAAKAKSGFQQTASDKLAIKTAAARGIREAEEKKKKAEKDAYVKSIGAPAMAENRIATALKKPVAEMLQMVETKEDVAKIKQFVDQTFVRYGAVNESAFAVRNQILEHVTQVGAQRRREHARMS